MAKAMAKAKTETKATAKAKTTAKTKVFQCARTERTALNAKGRAHTAT